MTARTLTYKLTTLPVVWPGPARTSRQRPPFKHIWTSTLSALAREVGMLGGSNVEIAIDVSERDIRQDGQLRADARPHSPRVILSFDHRKHGRMSFPCDTFSNWQANLDAIARVMEDLRRADRYGVRPGQQYVGFKALPASTAPTLSTTDAARIVTRHANLGDTGVVLSSSLNARNAVRLARLNSHPDRNSGDRVKFDEVQGAADVLSRHFGTPL